MHIRLSYVYQVCLPFYTCLLYTSNNDCQQYLYWKLGSFFIFYYFRSSLDVCTVSYTHLDVYKRQGYTQEEIADAIGVARSTYTRYESDKRLPDIYKLCALADYFDVSLDDLVGRDWKPKKEHKGRNIAIKPQPKYI